MTSLRAPPVGEPYSRLLGHEYNLVYYFAGMYAFEISLPPLSNTQRSQKAALRPRTRNRETPLYENNGVRPLARLKTKSPQPGDG